MKEKIDIQISSEALSIDACYAYVRHDGGGGNVLFIGTVRDATQAKSVSKLEFESFVPMAEKEMRKITDEISERWDVLRMSIHHRVGALEIGDIAVIIAISAPHRKAAFEACQYAIDTLKETVPIWKREFFEDGAVWVAAHP